MYRNLSHPTLLRLSHLHCHVKLTGVQTVQSKVSSKAKVKQSKLFVFASPLSYQYVTIYLSKLLPFFRTTLFIAFRFTPLTLLTIHITNPACNLYNFNLTQCLFLPQLPSYKKNIPLFSYMKTQKYERSYLFSISPTSKNALLFHQPRIRGQITPYTSL